MVALESTVSSADAAPAAPGLDSLSPRQTHAARLLAAGHTLDEVCLELHLARVTLYRWRQDPRFLACVNLIVRELADQALCQSAGLLTAATTRLQDLINTPSLDPKLQIHLAFRILSVYARPAYLRFLQCLPTNARQIAQRDADLAAQSAGRDATTLSDAELARLFVPDDDETK